MQDTSFERAAHHRADAIAQGIAETLTELEADDSETFELGAVPLDSPDPPPQLVAAGHSSNRQRRPRSDSSSRLILMAMLVSALMALGMVGFAVSEGFIP